MHFIILGAGLSGLAAATTLLHNGHTFQLLEQDAQVGGRAQTSNINGHLIDHGFQVFLPNYEEGIRFLDYEKLQLKSFSPGALVLYDKGLYDTIGDPLRRPFSVFNSFLSKVGSLSDKKRLLKLKTEARRYRQNPTLVDTTMSTYDFLVAFGFKQEMIHHFFIPFFSGVFFDQKLETSSAMFLFLYDKFATGLASVPAKGMGQLSRQMAAALPEGNIHLGEKIISVNKKSVQVASGNNYIGDKIILTASHPNPKGQSNSAKEGKWQSAHTLYFETPTAPHQKKLVGIVAKKNSLVNNVSVMSNISRAYAPINKHQIAVSIYGSKFDKSIENQIKEECKAWFGKQTEKWELVQKFHIKKALPVQQKVRFHFEKLDCQIDENIFQAGDTMLNGSIDGALKSGRLAAEYAMQS